MASPIVDEDLCTGCGLCEQTCPEVFELGDDGVAHLKEDAADCSEAGCCQEAADQCPVSAISV